MNKEIIRDEIKWLIEAINEQYDAIHSHAEKIPQIELDILMDNVRKFYEKLHLLQRMNDPVLFSEKKIKTATEPMQSAMPSTSGVTVRFSEPEPAGVKVEIPDEPARPPFQSSPVPFKSEGSVSILQESSPVAKKTSKHPEIDLFASEEPAFSIKLKDAREKTLGPKIPSERIENLKTAISINEKFMFINELFDGNLREYNETIETLNGFITLDQAADFLDLLRKKNFWNTGSNAFKKLKELVERRF